LPTPGDDIRAELDATVSVGGTWAHRVVSLTE
jgi:hypothetical protein